VLEEAVDKRWGLVLGCWLAALVPLAHAGTPIGLVTIVDGGEVTIIRDAQKLRAAEGVRLAAEDIVHVGEKVRVLRLELHDGTTFDVGPGSRLLLGSRTFGPQSSRAAQVYLAEGWIKAGSARGDKPVAAALASPAFDLVGLSGTAVARAGEGAAQVFIEAGRAEVHERRDGIELRKHKVGEGQFYAQKGAAAGAVQAGLPGELVGSMPRAFMDALPRRSARFAAVVIEPSVVGDAGYADVSHWLHGEAVLRPGFLQRWGLKAQDPTWRPGLVADVRRHAEWESLLFPPKRRPATAARREPATDSRRAPAVATRELPSPAALVRVLSSQAEAAASRPRTPGPALPTAADDPVAVSTRPARPSEPAIERVAASAPAAAPAAAAQEPPPASPPPGAQAQAAPIAPAAPASQGERAPIARSEPPVPGASPLSERAQ
jgi:hypothetical protein